MSKFSEFNDIRHKSTFIHGEVYREWRLNGVLHRVGGPAIYCLEAAYQAWFFEGKRHRVDGPAIICHDPPFSHTGYQAWYLNGEQIWWHELLKVVGQPGYIFSPLEVSMIEYYLEEPSRILKSISAL